jgi:hypothetical protein
MCGAALKERIVYKVAKRLSSQAFIGKHAGEPLRPRTIGTGGL